jgi:hypothetical protein
VREQMLTPHLINMRKEHVLYSMYSVQYPARTAGLAQSCPSVCTFLLCRPEILAGTATCVMRFVVLVLVQVELLSVVSAYDIHE